MADTTDVAAGAASALSEADLERVRKFTREPILLEGETLEDLAPGTARRRAVDAALAEIDAGAEAPSIGWRRRTTRCCSGSSACSGEDKPTLLDGAELNEHQVDALSGTLAALIAELESPEGERPRRNERNGQRRSETAPRPRRRPSRPPSRSTAPASRARRGGRATCSGPTTRSRRTGRRSRSTPRTRTSSPRPPEDPGAEPPLLVRARDRRRQDGRRRRLHRGLAHRRRPDPHPPPQPRRPVHRRDLRPRLQGPALAAAARRRRPPLRPGHGRDLPVVRAQRRQASPTPTRS